MTGEARDVTAEPDGSGPKDETAPVQGAELHDVDINQLVQGLARKDQAKIAKMLVKSQPEVRSALRLTRRDHMRLAITILVFGAIVLEAVAAVYIAAYAKSASWKEVLDWFTLSVAPLAAAAAIASTFWFPSREAD